MIDNIDIIKPLLQFPHEDIFYFVQVLQRKKDHPKGTIVGCDNNSRLIKGYFIASLEQLDKQYLEMKMLADVFSARVMINLNPRNFKKVGFHVLQKIANQMANNDFASIYKTYTSVCGDRNNEIDKRWLIDIDKDQLDIADEVENYIISLQKEINNRDYKIITRIPSKSGFHIITNPFNKLKFNEKYPKVEVHTNNPVNLYISDKIK